MLRMSTKPQKGFTVVELLVAMGLATIVMVGLVVLLVSLIQTGDRSVKTTLEIRENQSALTTIQRDMSTTVGFAAEASITDSKKSDSPMGATSGWQFQGTGENARILILKTYATTTQALDAGRAIVYFDDGVGGCPVGRTPVTNNVIYYVKDTTLYRRTLAASSTPTAPFCTGQTPAQVTTCQSGCAQTDVAVAQNVESFEVTYYASATDMTPIDTVYTTDFGDAGTILPSVKAVRVDVTSKVMVAGEPTRVNSYRRMVKGSNVNE